MAAVPKRNAKIPPDVGATELVVAMFASRSRRERSLCRGNPPGLLI